MNKSEALDIALESAIISHQLFYEQKAENSEPTDEHKVSLKALKELIVLAQVYELQDSESEKEMTKRILDVIKNDLQAN